MISGRTFDVTVESSLASLEFKKRLELWIEDRLEDAVLMTSADASLEDLVAKEEQQANPIKTYLFAMEPTAASIGELILEQATQIAAEEDGEVFSVTVDDFDGTCIVENRDDEREIFRPRRAVEVH